MKIALNWLRDYISLDGVELENMLEKLSDSGLEVEGVEKYQNYEGGFEGLFVGEVISCVKHPNADKLKINAFLRTCAFSKQSFAELGHTMGVICLQGLSSVNYKILST